MKTSSQIKNDERGVMIFALIGVVIILLSLAATAYFAKIKRQSQKEVVETGTIDEIESEIEKVKTELDSAAFEAGQKAIEKVRQEISGENRLPRMNVLKKKVSRNTTKVFEKYFEEQFGEPIEKRGREMSFYLQPVKKDQMGVEFDTLFMKEQRGTELAWEEVPGFFDISRKIRVNILDRNTGTFTTRNFEIRREIKTDLFILANRIKEFDIKNIRKMTDSMMFAYLNTKVYDADFEKEIGSETPFKDAFDARWLEEYDGEKLDFDSGKDRNVPFEKNSSGFVRGFHHDKGNLTLGSVLSEKEVKNIGKLSLLIEQISSFRSCDDELLQEVSKYFTLDEEQLLEMVGSGRKNKLNLQNLVVRLFVEKGTLSKDVFYLKLFLDSFTKNGISSLVEKDGTNTSLGMVKNTVQGIFFNEDRWRYDDFSDKVRPTRELQPKSSYLRGFISLYSNTMDRVLNSFRTDDEDLKRFVLADIRSNDPLPSLENISIIGKEGTKKIAESIVHTAKNLTRSFGFEESSLTEAGYSFYYLYFLNNWGMSGTGNNKIDPIDKINYGGISEIVQSRIVNEIDTRRGDLSSLADYERVGGLISEYNETDWYDGSDAQKDTWKALNQSLAPLENISKNDMFDSDSEDNTSSALVKYYSKLEKDIQVVKEKLSSLQKKRAKTYTENIVKIEGNFTANKWKSEAYEFLRDESEVIDEYDAYFRLVEDYLTASPENLSGSYGWELEDFKLADYIEIPPEEPDQSIGYNTIGLFTEEAIRGFKTPLDYTNSFRFFDLVNQNLYDLKGPRDGEAESRFKNLLKGKGDPFSQHLDSDELTDPTVKIDEKKIHSSDIEDIDSWWSEKTFFETAAQIKKTSRKLEKTASELEERKLAEEPYEAYSDASFYRTANEFLKPMISQTKTKGKHISNISRRTGYPYRLNGEEKKLPVVSAPYGNLTLTDSRSKENRTFSYSFDLEVGIDQAGQLIDGIEREATSIRRYESKTSDIKEWVNPFADESTDYYTTAFFNEFRTSDFELYVSTGDESLLASERYSSTGLVKGFTSEKHLNFAETVTPEPLIDRIYSPTSPPSLEIKNASIDRNVFNSSQNTAHLEIETGTNPIEESFFLQIIKRRDASETSNSWKRELNHLKNIVHDGKKDERTVLHQETISSHEIKGEKIELSFDMSGVGFSDYEEGELIIRIKPKTRVAWMKNNFVMDQTLHSSEDNELYSKVPQYADSEQLFIFPKDRTSYLGIFRWVNETEKLHSSNQNGFDFIENIPEDSWIVEKNGVHYLVDLADSKKFRDSLSGRYKDVSSKSPHSNSTVVPSDKIDEISPSSSSFLPHNGYRSLLESSLLPLYMSTFEDEKHLFPDRMIPTPTGEDHKEWKKVHELMTENNYAVEAEIQSGRYLFYRPGNHCGKERVDHAFEYARYEIISSNDPVHDHSSRLSNDIKEVAKLLRKAGLMDEFIDADAQDRRGLFMAASRARGEIDTVEDLDESYESFSMGNIAKSVDIIGEERTKNLLEWLKDERSSSYNQELRAFLTFDKDLIRQLKRKTESDSYRQALDWIDQKAEDMTFTECRRWSVKEKKDIESLTHLKELFSKENILKAASFGIKPAASRALNRSSHKVDLEQFTTHLQRLSKEPYFDSFIEELNSGDYSHLPSVYLAGKEDVENIEWMPFGDDGPSLLVDDRAVFYNASSSKDIDSAKRVIDDTLRDASKIFSSERVLVIIDLQSSRLNEDSAKELYRYVKERAAHHSPYFKSVGSVEVRIDGGKEFRYIHL